MDEIKIALAGNPNCGKTTLFNALTGATQYVGNWPGVTVEKKEGRLKGHRDVILQDLPGIYSLSPYTPEEVVSRTYLINEKPDVILDLVDASNLERNLYLTTQLLEVGVPVVVALNMMDLVEKRGDTIDIKLLSQRLNCPVVAISALNGTGVQEAAKLALAQVKRPAPVSPVFSDDLERVLAQISETIAKKCEKAHRRWYSVKVFEQDAQALETLQLPEADLSALRPAIAALEADYDDDAESIITSARYEVIAQLLNGVYRKQPRGLSTSDKIDRIVTHRVLALPIFAVVMWLVYFLSMETVGAMGTDWVNDVLFGALVPDAVGGWLEAIGCADWLASLVLDGIIGGVGAVLGFLPQMMVLFLCLAFLEDSGYMARVAFIMDRIFRRFGLSGKSFIAMMVAMGCGVPAVQASRTIENEKDRRMTIMTTTFIPCGAKLPIIAMIAGAFFEESAWVSTSAYFIGLAAIVVSGIILKKTSLFGGEPAPFVMELPPYHLPRVKGLLIHMWDRTKAFARKAGTIILLSTVVIWFLSSFGFGAEGFGMVEMESSLLAGMGGLFAVLFKPLGWGDWRMAVGAVSGLIAKENVVGTFGVLFGGLEEVAENGDEIWSALASSYSQIAGFSYMVFNLLCAPCFAAIGAIHREMGSGKWTMIAVGWQCGLAYCVSLMVYQLVGLLVGQVTFGVGTVAAGIVLAGMVYLLAKPKTMRNA